jgi:predicted XRE-type DNA-binding protein
MKSFREKLDELPEDRRKAILEEGKSLIVDENHIEIGSGNVFKDLGFPDADEHFEKSGIVISIGQAIESQNLKTEEAAKKLQLSREELERIQIGHFRQYSIEKLNGFLEKLKTKK